MCEEIINAKIEKVSLSMADHGCLVYGLTLKMNGRGCVYGGVVIGKGYLGAEKFEGCAKGTEALMRIMDVVGVHCWEDLTGKYVRVVDPGWGGIVDKIGNILEDKWFSQKEFFREEHVDPFCDEMKREALKQWEEEKKRWEGRGYAGEPVPCYESVSVDIPENDRVVNITENGVYTGEGNPPQYI